MFIFIYIYTYTYIYIDTYSFCKPTISMIIQTMKWRLGPVNIGKHTKNGPEVRWNDDATLHWDLATRACSFAG